jgi:hypothetical protein
MGGVFAAAMPYALPRRNPAGDRPIRAGTG